MVVMVRDLRSSVRRNESPDPQCLLRGLNGRQTKQRSQDQFCVRASDFTALNSMLIVKAAASTACV